MKKTIFRSIIVLIYSINNIHVGARLNRDQILYKILIEMLMKMRRKKILTSFLYCKFGLVLKTAQGPLGAQRPRVPDHSVGLGHEFGPRAHPTWAETGPSARQPIVAVGSHPTVACHFRQGKISARPLAPKTLIPFLLPFLSLARTEPAAPPAV